MKEFLTSLVGVNTVEQQIDIAREKGGISSREEYTPEWYQQLGSDLETVKRSIALAAERCHVEVTTLLVPGENDSEEEIWSLARWLVSVDRSIPLHLSRFPPWYRMTDKPPTPVERVYHLADAEREYLSFVYTGNC